MSSARPALVCSFKAKWTALTGAGQCQVGTSTFLMNQASKCRDSSIGIFEAIQTLLQTRIRYLKDQPIGPAGDGSGETIIADIQKYGVLPISSERNSEAAVEGLTQ